MGGWTARLAPYVRDAAAQTGGMTQAKKQAILRECKRIKDEARFARECARAAIKREDMGEVAFLTRTVTHLADQAQELVERVRESE